MAVRVVVSGMGVVDSSLGWGWGSWGWGDWGGVDSPGLRFASSGLRLLLVQ